MIAPDLYYPLMGGISLFLQAVLTIVLLISVLRQKNAGLLLLCLGSAVSLPVAAGTLLISILKTLRYAAEYKGLIKNIYLMITMLEPLSIFLMFAGILVLAVRNFNIPSRKTGGVL
jgi:hypothetical protein